MQKIELKFDQPEEIIDFVRIMNRYECDADVKYGSMVVDAKSIVGVLSLARSKTVEVILHTDECQEPRVVRQGRYGLHQRVLSGV